MKKFLLYLCICLAGIGIFNIDTYANGIIPIEKIQDFDTTVKDKTVDVQTSSASPIDGIYSAGFSVLTTIKTMVGGLLVIYIVYAGIQMVISMGNDEEKLTSAKNQLWYTIVAFVFINIPGTLYDSFDSKSTIQVDTRANASWFKTPNGESNLFIDIGWFGKSINTDIIGFIEVAISIFAIVALTLAGIKMITSRGNEEEITEAKNKFIWSTAALLLVGFLETWKHLVYEGKVEDGGNFFESLVNLFLFFAAPVAIIFLTYAAYLYITANGDDEKVNKAKSIIVNIFIATAVILASYTFLVDLQGLII